MRVRGTHSLCAEHAWGQGTSATHNPQENISREAREVKDAHLVVIGELLSLTDGPLGIDADMLLGVHCDGLGVAVGIAAVVDVPRTPTLQA